MLAKPQRFHGHNSLRFVYKNGSSARGEYTTTKIINNPHRSTSRIAVVVSKKIDKRAVVRNQIRRRIYAVTRDIFSQITTPTDIVIIVNSPTIRALSPLELQQMIRGQLRQLDVI